MLKQWQLIAGWHGARREVIIIFVQHDSQVDQYLVLLYTNTDKLPCRTQQSDMAWKHFVGFYMFSRLAIWHPKMRNPRDLINLDGDLLPLYRRGADSRGCQQLMFWSINNRNNTSTEFPIGWKDKRSPNKTEGDRQRDCLQPSENRILVEQMSFLLKPSFYCLKIHKRTNWFLTWERSSTLLYCLVFG